MARDNPQLIAGGNISPSRFVKWDLSGGGDFTVIQATDNTKIAGISMEGTREAPIPSVSTAYAAQSGESFKVYGDGEICLLELGGTVVAGDDLSSDANGKGTAITGGTSTQEIGATALEGGASGELILVQVRLRSEGQTAVSS